MKVSHIVTGVVLVLAVAGAARADFILNSTQHLDVTTLHVTGVLWDFSTADVLASGYITNAYVNNNAFLRVLEYRTGGGQSVETVWAYNTSRVGVSGGSLYALYAYNDSSMTISGGFMNYLYARDNSSVDIFGGTVYNALHAYDTSSVEMSGGNISTQYAGSSVYTHNASSMNISGGSVSYLYAGDTSSVDISGGTLYALYAYDSSVVTFDGYDFRATGGLVLDGELVLGTGVLTGKWSDGTAWAVSIASNAAGATILAVPEPATLSLLALGGLALLHRRRVASS